MAVTIEAVSTARARKLFVRFPWTIYRDDPCWVPPLLMERQDFLNPAKNPFFDHAEVRLFLARDSSGALVGRIAATVNENHVARHGEKAGFFGLFESVDSQDVACALFDAAAAFLRSKGMRVMRGPENLSINDDVGLLVRGFETPPFLMMPHNPPYYERLVAGCGFHKAMDLLAYYGEHGGHAPERLERGMETLRKRYNFAIRSANMKRFSSEVQLIKRIYNEAWQDNWNAIPMTDPEFAHLAKDLKLVLDPEMCLIAEVDGQAAGFLLALPDINRALIRISDGRLLPFGLLKLLWHKRRIDRVRVIALGILPRYRQMALSSALIYEAYRRAIARGYRGGELSWILESNGAMNNALLKEGFVVHKTYRVYDRAL